jgi:anti-sigma regulatory factor (Ser/Thr protein kinase)
MRTDDASFRGSQRMSGAPDVRLTLGNLPENVALVRQALTGLAGTIGIDEALLSDIKTAVSEACNNVVLHAYENGGPGPLDVYFCPNGREITVVVSDEGSGIQPRPPEPDAAMQGVGLSLIQALTESVEFAGGDGQGTEVRMTFRSDAELDVPASGTDGDQPDAPRPEADTVVSAIDPLVAPVLSSVIAVLAARAGFSVERLSDAQLVTDAIAAHAGGVVAGRRVHAGIDAGEQRLELRIGPLVQGGSRALVDSSAVGGLGSVLERLADDVATESRDGHEELRLVIADRR